MGAMDSFQSLGDKRSLSQANARFLKVFKDRADAKRVQTIGTPGGSDKLMTWYSKSLDTWVAPNTLANRYWNAFGCGDPFIGTKVAPCLEINPPLEAGSSNTATLFLKNADGEIEIAHTGRAGGGQKGVGKNAFQQFHPLYEHVLVDGKARDLYMLGSLANADDLAANVTDFVKVIRAFKDGVASPSSSPPTKSAFKPEFEGSTNYTVPSARTATYTHGRVVNGLYGQLAALGVSASRTHAIDLFAEPVGTRRGVVFEAKTSSDTQSIFTCIGQLVFLAPYPEWVKVAVLPAPIKNSTRSRLKELGLLVLEYSFATTGVPVFAELDSLVTALGAK